MRFIVTRIEYVRNVARFFGGLHHIFARDTESHMIIGDGLRAMREERKLSQEDIERRTGLLLCYIYPGHFRSPGLLPATPPRRTYICPAAVSIRRDENDVRLVDKADVRKADAPRPNLGANLGPKQGPFRPQTVPLGCQGQRTQRDFW